MAAPARVKASPVVLGLEGQSSGWVEVEFFHPNPCGPDWIGVFSPAKFSERYAVYVVKQMWPEGVPTAPPVQEILLLQAQTMEMIYRVIAQELKAMNIENAHPHDNLNFYCLGNWEESSSNDNPESDKSAAVIYLIFYEAKNFDCSRIAEFLEKAQDLLDLTVLECAWMDLCGKDKSVTVEEFADEKQMMRIASNRF